MINRSPESISRDCYAADPGQAVLAADRYRELGVRVVDVGGQSSSFLAPRLSTGEETDRAVPTVAALAARGWAVPSTLSTRRWRRRRWTPGRFWSTTPPVCRTRKWSAWLVRSQVPFVLMYIEGADPHKVRLRDDGAGKPQRAAARLEARRRDWPKRG